MIRQTRSKIGRNIPEKIFGIFLTLKKFVETSLKALLQFGADSFDRSANFSESLESLISVQKVSRLKNSFAVPQELEVSPFNEMTIIASRIPGYKESFPNLAS